MRPLLAHLTAVIVAAFLLYSTPLLAHSARTVQAVASAAVKVYVPEGSGSAILVRTVSSESWFLTCAHVTAGCRNIVSVSFGAGGEHMPVTVAAEDAYRDLALLHYDGPMSVAPVRLSSDTPDPGTAVFSVGAPLGVESFATFGWVAAAPREVDGHGQQMLIDYTATPGESGSGLCNEQGELVGIVRACIPGTRIGLAVSLATIKQFLNWQ